MPAPRSANGVATAAESKRLPSRVKASRGSTLISRSEGRALRKGTPSSKSRSRCVVFSGWSTKSAAPPWTTMLCSANCAGSSPSFAGAAARRCQDVVDVVAAVGEARQADHRRVDLEPVDDGREAEHPAHRDLAAQLPDLQLRRRRVARAGQGDVVDPQRQRPRVEGDVADREAPAERLERDPLGAALERRRDDQRGRAPERRQDDDGDAGANQPAAGEEAAHAVLVRVGRARCRSR